jgi:glycosyltransferase involved in cell wall biosynthesis
LNFPKISIVTPSYNQGQYIEQTILSIIDQGYPNLEYIIIDGGSTDNTVDIIKKYSDQITYWVSEPDKGQSDALNKGLKKCSGHIFNWINSDDYLEAGALFKVADTFVKNPSALQVCGYSRIFDSLTNDTIISHRCELFASTEKTITQEKINQQASFYKLSVVKELGVVNNSLNCVMDLELWFRFLCKYGQEKIFLIDDLLGHFRIHPQSKTSELETRFRKESNGLFHELLRQINPNDPFLLFFNYNKNYKTDYWDKNLINYDDLYEAIAERFFYDFYRNENYMACKKAFKLLFKSNKISRNKHTLRMFFKIFLGI